MDVLTMKLIDANKLSEAFDEEDADVCFDYGDGCDWGFSYKLVHDLIARAPIVEAVTAVQCKDCKHRVFKYVNEEIGKIGGCELFNRAMPNNAFCSFSERKDEINES